MSEENQEFKIGSYEAKVSGCNFKIIGEKETPMVEIAFKLEEESKTIRWNSFLTETILQQKGISVAENTVNQLIDLGFRGKDVIDMADPNRPVHELFDVEKIWNVEVDYQTDRNGVKTKYLEVKWFNDPNKQSMRKDKVSFDETRQVMKGKGMSFAGLFMKNRKGQPKQESKQDSNAAASSGANTDVNGKPLPF